MQTKSLPRVLITGASRGIGLTLASQYAATREWVVHATCREPSRAEPLQRLAAGSGDRVVLHPLDVTDLRQIGALAEELKGEPIDLLINNAGVYVQGPSGLGQVDEKGWLDVLRVNTVAPLMVTEALLPNIASSHRKVVAAISSMMGSINDNSSGGYYAYRSSKAALNMVMRSLAIDLRPRGITCVALSPGWVRTDMGGATAPLSPEQSVSGLRKVLDSVTLADTGRFLCHDGSEGEW